MDRFSTRSTFTKAMSCLASADEALVERLWADPNSLVDCGEKLVQKDCVRTTVRLNAHYEQFVVKRYVERSFRHFAKQCVSRSRAQRCWTDCWYLYDHGYPTPMPIAYFEERLAFLRGSSFFVYEFVEGKTLRDKAAGENNQRLIRKYILQLVDIWRLHFRLRVNLTDGHPANFLINSAGKMWVIDLDKLQRFPIHAEIVPCLKSSFESTMRGVFYDPAILKFGQDKLEQALAEEESFATSKVA